MTQEIRIIIGLFVATIAIRILFLELYWESPSSLWDDEADYVGLALYIKSGGSWVSSNMPSMRPPLLSLIISPVSAYDPHLIRLFLVSLSSLVPVIIYFICKSVFPGCKYSAIITASAWAIYPPAIWYSSLISTESLSSLFICISILIFLYNLKNPYGLLSILLGVSLSLLLLTRSSYVFLPFIFIGITLIRHIILQDLFNGLKQSLMILVGVIIISTPMIIRNASHYETILPTETRLAYGLAISNGDFNDPVIKKGGYSFARNPDILSNAPQYLTLTNPNVSKKEAFQLVWREIREHPASIPIILFNRTINFWGSRPDPFDPQLTPNDLIMFVIWIPILLLLLSSFAFPKSYEQWLLLVIIIYAYSTSVIFWTTPRFRFPIEPLIFILACYSTLNYLSIIPRGRRIQ